MKQRFIICLFSMIFFVIPGAVLSQGINDSADEISHYDSMQSNVYYVEGINEPLIASAIKTWQIENSAEIRMFVGETRICYIADEHLVCLDNHGRRIYMTPIGILASWAPIVDCYGNVIIVGYYKAKPMLIDNPSINYNTVVCTVDSKGILKTWDIICSGRAVARPYYVEGAEVAISILPYTLETAYVNQRAVWLHRTYEHIDICKEYPSIWQGNIVRNGDSVILCINDCLLKYDMCNDVVLWKTDVFELDESKYGEENYIDTVFKDDVYGLLLHNIVHDIQCSNNGYIFVSQYSNMLTAVKATSGEVVWTKEIISKHSPVIDDNGDLYVCNPVGKIYKLDMYGNVILIYDAQANVMNERKLHSSGAMIGDKEGNLYFALGNWIVSISKEGEMRWKKKMPDAVCGKPAFTGDGYLIVLCEDGYIYFIIDGSIYNK